MSHPRAAAGRAASFAWACASSLSALIVVACGASGNVDEPGVRAAGAGGVHQGGDVGGQGGSGVEICGNGKDDDGNGKADDGCPCDPGVAELCYLGPAAQAGLGDCTWGSQACVEDAAHDQEMGSGTWGECTGYGSPSNDRCDGVDHACTGHPPPKKAESCNGRDDDCDGEVDEDVTQSCVDAQGNMGIQICVSGAFGPCVCTGACAAGGTCEVGDTEACVLPSGSVGRKSCGNDGTYGACSCIEGQTSTCTMPPGLGGGPPISGEAQCTNDGQNPCLCLFEAEQPCLMADGSTGTRSCVPGSPWSACGCSGASCETGGTQIGSQSGCLEGQVEECTATTTRTCKDGIWSPCTGSTTATQGGTCVPGSVVASEFGQVLECDQNETWFSSPDGGCTPHACNSCLQQLCLPQISAADVAACATIFNEAYAWISHCGADRTRYWQTLTNDPNCGYLVRKLNACKGESCVMNGDDGPCNFF